MMKTPSDGGDPGVHPSESDHGMTTTTAPPRFSLWELAYLLAGRTEAGAARSRELVGIPEVTGPEDDAFSAGLSSLLLRGMMEERGSDVVPVSTARAVGYALGEATQWVSLTALIDGEPDSVFLVGSDRVKLMFRPSPVDSYDVFLLPPDADLPVETGRLVASVASRRDRVDVIVKAAGLERARAAFLAAASDAWKYGVDVVFPGDAQWPAPDLELTEVSKDAVPALVAELVTSVSS